MFRNVYSRPFLRRARRRAALRLLATAAVAGFAVVASTEPALRSEKTARPKFRSKS